jgi:cell wall-associated NlpC family hydrolase
MRTLTRRGVLAGAMALFAPLAGSTAVLADESSDDTESGLARAEPNAQLWSDTSALHVDDAAEDAQAAAEQRYELGLAIANFALAYVGYPYVAGGNSAYGFDCSGFTQFVYINMLGWDIGHGVAGQPAAGYWVDWGYWMPGDLVVFQNTYMAGVSHVGIYIGDGQFVHAENYGTGVTISSLYSDYYAAHYWGTVRLI